MKDKETDRIEKTSDFLDLMSRSERKAWERAQKEEHSKEENIEGKHIKEEPKEKVASRQEKYKISQEDKEVKKVLKDNKPLKPIGIEQMENTQSIKAVEEEELQVGELGKTQHFLNMTQEIASALGENVQDNLFEEKKENSKFNPITWIGLLIIFCFGYFIYLVIRSGYDEELLLLIDSGFLLGIIFCFGLSIISSRKWTKIFSIFNFLVILAFIGTNAFLLYDWNTVDEKEEEKEPIVEKTKNYTLSCTTENIDIEVKAKDNIITRIEKKQIYSSKEELNEIAKIFENQEGITTQIDENNLLITFDFETLDVNQYKISMRNYLEYYRNTSDFTYVEEDKLLYNTYKETELKDFECTEKEES